MPDRAPADLDGQIEELIAPLCLDLSIWRDLSSRYGGNLFAGLFMTTHNGLEATEYFNEGLAIEPKALSLVGSRGLRLDLDIYAGSAVANREEFQTR